MRFGGLGPCKFTRAPKLAIRKVDGSKRRGRPAEPEPAAPSAFPEGPPRVGAGSSEIAMLDAAGRIVVVNQAWQEAIAAYGFDLPDAGIGIAYVDVACRFLPDLDRAALELSLSQLMSGAAREVRHTYAIATLRGPRWRHVQITPLAIGTESRFVAIHDDFTDLAITQEALKATSEQLLTARDEERERIAMELHDSTGQHLAVVSLGLARLRRASLPGGLGTAIIDEIFKALNEAVKETRTLAYLMKPRGLARTGLAATVRHFLEGFARRTGLEVSLEVEPAVDRLPLPLQHAALRIVQEALMNAHRHAQPQSVSVELAVKDGQFTVSVSDDGRGMASDQDEACHGVGIPGMRARAQQFSGQLSISSDASGTRVVAALPLA